MPVLENPMSFVRLLKGAPGSILWALLFTRRAMTNQELQVWTGYADENVSKGLAFLEGLNWVTGRTSRGPWSLATGMQLPLSEDAPDDSDFIGIARLSAASGDT